MCDSDPSSDPNGARGGRHGPVDAGMRLGDLLGCDPGLSERLAVLDPAFRDLAKVSADAAITPQMTVREAAGRAGVPVAVLLAVITGDAPRSCLAEAKRERQDQGREEEPPDWIEGFDERQAVRLDVRPLLAQGRDPFTTVMASAAAVPPGGSLVIDAPFDPVPLRRVLEGRGFLSFARRLSGRHWRVYCPRPGTAPPAPAARPTAPGAAAIWRDGDVVHIDVRGLSAPAPLTAILTLLEGGPHDGIIIVHHEREPAYLFPELLDRGWDWTHLAGEPGEVRLRLTRRA